MPLSSGRPRVTILAIYSQASDGHHLPELYGSNATAPDSLSSETSQAGASERADTPAACRKRGCEDRSSPRQKVREAYPLAPTQYWCDSDDGALWLLVI